MLQLENQTPFEANFAVLPNQEGRDTAVVVVKATFEMFPTVAIAEIQQPIHTGDVHWGDPLSTSLKYASELHLPKPATDVGLIGQAYTPDGQMVSQLDVGLRVGPLKQVVRILGDRIWRQTPLGPRPSDPAPFQTMPLLYERAYGGYHEREEGPGSMHADNPVGCGFVGERSLKELLGMPCPNFEDPNQPLDGPLKPIALAGFGFIAPHWLPRLQYAGTYDQPWQEHRAPFLPKDFDARYFQVAHPHLIADGYLGGGETVELWHLSRHDPLFGFKLPTCTFAMAGKLAGKWHHFLPVLDTVLLEPDEDRMTMIWRGHMLCDKRVLALETIRIQLDQIKGVAA